MTHLEAIRARLVNDAATSALVGARIFPQFAPQGVAAPFVVITTVSDVPQNSMNGAPSDRLRIARVQVDAYGLTCLSAHAVADAVDEVISSLRESDLGALRESSQDLYDDEASLHRVSMDFTVAL